jgi:predicted anti-sigma-YlaC factor YlaD
MGLKPTCKEIHRLTSESLDRELSLTERARSRLHLLVCTACRNFDRQMQLIRRAMRRLTVPQQADPDQEEK